METFDALDFEYFDAEGKRLRPTVVERRVSLHLDTGAKPEPEQLLGLIQAYVEAVAKRRDFREADRVLLEEVQEAPMLRESVVALGRFIDANQSRRMLGRLTKRKRP